MESTQVPMITEAAQLDSVESNKTITTPCISVLHYPKIDLKLQDNNNLSHYCLDNKNNKDLDLSSDMFDIISNILKELVQNCCDKAFEITPLSQKIHSYSSHIKDKSLVLKPDIKIRICQEINDSQNLNLSTDDNGCSIDRSMSGAPSFSPEKKVIGGNSDNSENKAVANSIYVSNLSVIHNNNAENLNNTSEIMNSMLTENKDFDERKQCEKSISFSPLSTTSYSDSDSEIFEEKTSYPCHDYLTPEITPLESRVISDVMQTGRSHIDLTKMQNTSEEFIDLLAQCKSDYSAETPVMVTDLSYDIGAVITSVESHSTNTCQTQSKKHTENVLFDKTEMIFTNSPTLNNFRSDIKVTEPEVEGEIIHGEVVCVYEKQEIEAVSDGTGLHAFFKEDIYDYEYDNSTQNKSIDINNGSFCSYIKPIPLEDSQFKYMLEDRDEMNIIDEVPVNSPTHLHVLEQNDLDIDINRRPELDESKTSDSSDLLGERSDMLVNSNVIMHCIQPTVGNKKMKINDVLALDKNRGRNQLKSNNKIEGTEKLAKFPRDEEYSQRENISNLDNDMILHPTCEYGMSLKGLSLSDEEREEELAETCIKYKDGSFELIEDMCDIKSSPDIPCAQSKTIISNNPDNNHHDMFTPDPASDDSEDYPSFPTTQCFKPSIISDYMGADSRLLHTQQEANAESRAHIPDFLDNNYEFEDEAIVPVPSYKRGISQVYTTKEYDEECHDSTELVPCINQYSTVGMLKLDHSKLPISTCFKWNPTFTCKLNEMNGCKMQPELDGGNLYMKPLVTCSRPIRLGLSKKQKTRTLHPHLR
ncbi:hypothetical protein SNE40_011589 [Patella caerulea]|uniref:Uncharacterized protein n=1 Tax=Patella caerulea TaxID=87958 RepID=A0AAN8JNR9_PATCE